jgi:hypothetical protein
VLQVCSCGVQEPHVVTEEADSMRRSPSMILWLLLAVRMLLMHPYILVGRQAAICNSPEQHGMPTATVLPPEAENSNLTLWDHVKSS